MENIIAHNAIRRGLVVAAATGAALAAIPAHADYVWQGSASGNWNASDANWNADGTPGQRWTDGADAVFNDSASTFAVTIPSGTAVAPAGTTFTNATAYTLGGAGGIAGTGAFAKHGAGDLTISGVNNSFTGDILITGGTTILSGNKDQSDIVSGALGNPRAARTVTVTNATLKITGKNPFGGGGRSKTAIQTALKFYNSTFELCPNFAFSAGDVYLHDSTVIVHGGYPTSTPGGRWGSLAAENLFFSGTHPLTIQGNVEGSGIAQTYAGMLLGKFAQATIDVPDITGNADTDVFIKMPVFRINANAAGDKGFSSGFRKTGAGTLELGGRDSYSNFSSSDYYGDVDVVEGTLKMSYGATTYDFNRSSAFGAAQFAHTFTVHPGATLQLASSDLQGQLYATNRITIRVNGGTLSQTAGVANGLGTLILENSTLSYSGANSQNNFYVVSEDQTQTNNVPVVWPTFAFNGGVSFLGTTQYSLSNGNGGNGVHSRFFFGTDDGRPSDFHVAEITGNGVADDTPDVILDARLEDAPPWYAATTVGDKRIVTGLNHPGQSLNMRKTGPGMLRLDNRYSTTTGRIEVVEGTLCIGGKMQSYEANFECPANTPLGDLRDPNRTALVLNGGTLWITNDDTFGQGSAVNGATFAVTNGTIRQSSGKANPLPVLDLYDATFDYSGANTGYHADLAEAQPWGTFIFSQRVRFDGTRPYDLQNRGGNCYFSLGWQSDSYQTPSTFNTSGGYIDQHGKTEFYVADITGDADPDVTIGVVLKFPCRWNGNQYNSLYSKTYFRTGLLKTGPGTLRLNSADATHYYSEATRVNAGTLLVDSHTFHSTNVFVQAGAFLGGTGTVVRTTIETGGGFTAAPGQTAPLTLDAVELPPNGVVALDIPFTGTREEMDSYRVPVVSASGLDGATWNVTVNGGPVPRGCVAGATVSNGVVYGTLSREAFTLIMR